LVEVGDQVFYVFNSHGNSDQAIRDAQTLPLLGWDARVGFDVRAYS
jgi:hypothetical protein